MATEKLLIDLQAVNMDEVDTSDCTDVEDILSAVITYLSEQPIVDAVPVVHGHWEKTIDNCTVMHKCSVCGARVVKGFYEYENPNRYCYHCGAKMDGDKDSYGHNAEKCDTVTYKGVKLPKPPKEERPMKITEGVILKVEHDLLVSQILFDCPEEDRAAMAMYIAGVNAMAQAVIEVMEGERKDGV